MGKFLQVRVLVNKVVSHLHMVWTKTPREARPYILDFVWIPWSDEDL